MRASIPTLVAAAAIAASPVARADIVDHEIWIANTPPEIPEAGARHELWDEYVLGSAPTPYLSGDLDGDGRLDYVVSVSRRSDGAFRFVVLWGKARKKPAWFPEGHVPTHDKWFWYIHPERRKVPAGTDGSRAPRLKGDAVVISEPSPTILYWTGKKLAEHPIDVPWPTVDDDAPPSWLR